MAAIKTMAPMVVSRTFGCMFSPKFTKIRRPSPRFGRGPHPTDRRHSAAMLPSWPKSIRRPGLIIAGRLFTLAAGQDMARWPVGKLGSRQIGLMQLLPDRPLGRRQGSMGAMQPGIPVGRYLARLDGAAIHHPAAFPLLTLGAPIDIIFVAKLIGADQFAAKHRKKTGADRHPAQAFKNRFIRPAL